MIFRQRQSLDGPWQFWTDPDSGLTPTTLVEAGAVQVEVPAPWQSQHPDLRFYAGVGWYQRQIDLPAAWLDEGVIILGFGAADDLTEVWLNGIKVGEHEGSYLPFELDITPATRPGPNRITVRIADSSQIFPEIPHGKKSWYGPISGLWQSVWIERRPANHILSALITPFQDRVAVEVTLNRPLGPDDCLTFEITGPDGKVCARSESTVPITSIPVSKPRLWDIDSPDLYQLSVVLKSLDEGTQAHPIDALTEAFGFRSVEARDGQILLNGRPIYLRGALDQDYYPEGIYSPPSQEYIEEQFRKARQMGLNCIRLHIKIADPRYYAAADRAGILIWTELPNWQLLTPDARERARQTLTGMVERDWNHPSIVIWTLINESWGVDLTDPEQRLWLSENYDYLKSIDPYRLVVGNSACWGNFQVVTDLEDFHFYAAIPDHYLKWRRWVENFAGRPSWTFARSYSGYADWRKYMKNPWYRTACLPAPEVRRRGDEPLLVSEFGNWGLPDIKPLYDCYNGEPWWFETGYEWGEGVVYPHGVEQRFRTYHLDRVFPSLSDLSRATQKLQFTALKYEIEQIRRHSPIMGYVITEFTDVHWESNGLLDMCRNPKVHFDQLGEINRDDMIIPEWRRLTFWEGERCQVEIWVSHFSRKDLEGSRLEWSVDLNPEVRGVFANLRPAPAGVTRAGLVTFEVPSLPVSSRAHLELRWIGPDGSLAASSRQELFFFPRRSISDVALSVYAPTMEDSFVRMGYPVTSDPSTASIAVVDRMTDEHREYLMSGGRVVWLADAVSDLQTYLGDIRIAKRKNQSWQGDWVSNFSWIRQDGMFSNIPTTDGLVDFAFAGLTPNYVIKGFSPREYARSVHAGMFVGWLHKTIALMGEKQIGKGRLLVTTFRLRSQLGKNPVATLLLEDMVAHLAKQ